MSVVVVGSVALDTVETPFGKVADVLGGSATYFSAAASFFTPVKLVAVVGKDFPRPHIKFLESRGVDLKGLKEENGKTFRWSGRYHEDLNQRDTLSLQLNVFEQFSPELPASYTKESCVFLANIDPLLQGEVLRQVKNPKLVVCDTMDHWITQKKDALLQNLPKVHVFILNDSEAKLLSGCSNLIKAASEILKAGPKVVVVKKGEHGALMFHQLGKKMELFAVPAFPLDNAKDPTGAGDSFAGGFVGYLSKFHGKLNPILLRRAMVYGTVMASFTVEKFGVERFQELTSNDIHQRYKEFRKIVSIPGE